MNFVLLYLGLAWGSDHKDSETGVSNLFGTQGWVLEISEKTFFFQLEPIRCKQVLFSCSNSHFNWGCKSSKVLIQAKEVESNS